MHELEFARSRLREQKTEDVKKISDLASLLGLRGRCFWARLSWMIPRNCKSFDSEGVESRLYVVPPPLSSIRRVYSPCVTEPT